MRFIGSKNELLPFIKDNIKKYCKKSDRTIGDLFCGTGVVSGLFKKMGFSVIANDNLYFCSMMAKSILLNDIEPKFKNLIEKNELPTKIVNRLSPTNYDIVHSYLNNLEGIEGYIYKNYSPGGTKEHEHERMYYTDGNAKKIDAIREKIFEWQSDNLLTESEEALLLTDLMRAANKVANIAGTYGMFMKKWMDKRVFKTLMLNRSKFIKSNKNHQIYNQDANKLIEKINCDILYLDPPYTWRHYGSYYHMLETISRWDKPELKGISGLRPWEDTKSLYCYKNRALDALLELYRQSKSNCIFLSYNNEGLISHDLLIEKLSEFGKLSIEEKKYKRYKSNNNGSNHNGVMERLYIVTKN